MKPSDDTFRNIHFVTLGCPKNRVDSELMLGHLHEAGLEFSTTPEDADVVVVNTCGFIEDAKKESIEVILEMARHRAEGRVRKLIVTGCLVQRYAKDLADEIPEVDAFLGNGAYEAVAQLAGTAPKASAEPPTIDVESPRFLHQATTPRINTFLPHSAYVKVSEGCDQKCAFCIIPKLRGKQRSRPVADIVREAEGLAARGVVELNLVAQDLTGYGYDQKQKPSLADLLVALDRVDGLQWIRVHYLYPRPFSKALLRALGESEKVVPYVDMPLQHIADRVLKRMNRGRPRRFVERLLEDIRGAIPDVTLRTSFIVGFPGETDRDFEELCDFVSDQDFARVGVFKFSREEDTPSFEMENQVEPEVVDARYHHLMQLLRQKSRDHLAEFEGRRVNVLVDGVSSETELLLEGRHAGQAPEVDGTIYLAEGQELAQAGDIVEVEITETHDYDLVGRIERVLHRAPERPSHPRMDALSLAPLTAGRRRLRVVT
ncbi:MAG: 30S ribosomal protein S12 methylthiotransferase RimO [Myxococcota bacterium]